MRSEGPRSQSFLAGFLIGGSSWRGKTRDVERPLGRSLADIRPSSLSTRQLEHRKLLAIAVDSFFGVFALIYVDRYKGFWCFSPSSCRGLHISALRLPERLFQLASWKTVLSSFLQRYSHVSPASETCGHEVRFPFLPDSDYAVLSRQYEALTMSTYHSSELWRNSNLITHTNLSSQIRVALCEFRLAIKDFPCSFEQNRDAL